MDTGSATTQGPQRCFLLELPKELRLQIYEDVFVPYDLEVFSEYDLTMTWPTSGPLSAPSFLGKSTPNQHGTTLLRTCKQIAYEATAVLLTRCTALTISPTDFRPTGKSFNLEHLNRLGTLDHLSIKNKICQKSARQDHRDSMTLVHNISKTLRTKDVCFEITDHSRVSLQEEIQLGFDLADTLMRAWPEKVDFEECFVTLRLKVWNLSTERRWKRLDRSDTWESYMSLRDSQYILNNGGDYGGKRAQDMSEEVQAVFGMKHVVHTQQAIWRNE